MILQTQNTRGLLFRFVTPQRGGRFGAWCAKKGLTCLKVVMMGLVLCKAGAAAMSLNIAQAALIGSGGGACRSRGALGHCRVRCSLFRQLAFGDGQIRDPSIDGKSTSRWPAAAGESESGTGFWGTGRAKSDERRGRRLRPSRLPLVTAWLRPLTRPRPPGLHRCMGSLSLSFSSRAVAVGTGML